VFRAFTDDLHWQTEFLIDLGRDEEALLGSYAPGKRKQRKALDSGLAVTTSSAPDDVATLRRLQSASSARARQRDNVYALPDRAYYARICEACVRPGLSHFVFANLAGRPVSVLMYLVNEHRCIVQRGGTTDEGVACDAARYLHYALIQHLKESGCRSVYFGAVPVEATQPDHPEHGLYRFKCGFPAAQVPACRALIRLTHADS
jgi:lipid II:glycine glycyltransferase (peptidoglycan interpeptide bridge formation enzyme)